MSRGETWIVWLAQGMGAGRLRPAPGTWGSLVGLAWTLILVSTANPWAYALGTLAAIVAAIPACTIAERALGVHDPSSVVIDEWVSMPLAFGGHAAMWVASGAGLPTFATFRGWWPHLVVAFVLFRILDIAKPWPIRALQRLPGGLGIVLDDVGAGMVAAAMHLLGTWAMFAVRLALG